MTRIDGSLETGKLSKYKTKMCNNAKCWVCEGWSQLLFQYDPKEARIPGVDEYTPIYIHLEEDDFRPDLMERGADGVYRITRMVPPGQ